MVPTMKWHFYERLIDSIKKARQKTPWESVLGFSISELQGGLSDQIMGGEELLACCRHRTDLRKISSITLDIQATPPPSSGGLCSLEIDWKCEMPSRHILYNLLIDFWHHWFFSVFAYLWQACDNLEWQSFKPRYQDGYIEGDPALETEISNQLFDGLATNLLPIFMSPLGSFVTSLASPLYFIWRCRHVQIQVCQYYVYIKTLRKLTVLSADV